jgi:hypothetical protein
VSGPPPPPPPPPPAPSPVLCCLLQIKISDFGFCMQLPFGKSSVKVDKITHPNWVAPEVCAWL